MNVSIDCQLDADRGQSIFYVQGWGELCVKTLRVYRQIFRSREKDLGGEEYIRLLETARALCRGRLALMMANICAICLPGPHNRCFWK